MRQEEHSSVHYCRLGSGLPSSVFAVYCNCKVVQRAGARLGVAEETVVDVL